MKNIKFLLLSLLVAGTSFANNEKIAPSKISKVTVYSQGAQIYRTANYSVGKGVSKIVIDNLSSQIDAKSVQIQATGNLVILDSKYSIFHPKPKEVKLEGLPLKLRREILALEDSMKFVNYNLEDLTDELAVLNQTKSILQKNGAVKGTGKVNDSLEMLKGIVSFYPQKMNELNKNIRKITRKKEGVQKIYNRMKQRLRDLKNHESSSGGTTKPQGPSYRITLTVSSPTGTKGKMNISYIVSNAGWVPIYDLRSDVNSGKVNLTYKAQVFQNSGVDWEGVPLTISTNNPYQNKTKPTLHPWYLDYYNYELYQKRQSQINAYQNQFDEEVEEVVVSSKEKKAANKSFEFTEVIDKMISAEFKIDLPYTIKSNNEKHLVLVSNNDLNANFKYFSIPKFDRGAYLVAQITKLDELQLVPAKANIFFDGTYMGETYLNPSTMSDTLDLSLGKDPNIIIKRVLLEKDCKKKVVGSKIEHTSAYSIIVKNLKSKSIQLVIQDQVPVSRNADIEVKLLDKGSGKFNERSGSLTWELTLKPQGKKTIDFKYEVKHDKEKNVNL